MTLNGVTALILRYFTEYSVASGARCLKAVEVLKVSSSKCARSLSHLLMSFLLVFGVIRICKPFPVSSRLISCATDQHNEVVALLRL